MSSLINICIPKLNCCVYLYTQNNIPKDLTLLLIYVYCSTRRSLPLDYAGGPTLKSMVCCSTYLYLQSILQYLIPLPLEYIVVNTSTSRVYCSKYLFLQSMLQYLPLPLEYIVVHTSSSRVCCSTYLYLQSILQ